MARVKWILRIELSAKINAEVFENDSAEGASLRSRVRDEMSNFNSFCKLCFWEGWRKFSLIVYINLLYIYIAYIDTAITKLYEC